MSELQIVSSVTSFHKQKFKLFFNSRWKFYTQLLTCGDLLRYTVVLTDVRHCNVNRIARIGIVVRAASGNGLEIAFRVLIVGQVESKKWDYQIFFELNTLFFIITAIKVLLLSTELCKEFFNEKIFWTQIIAVFKLKDFILIKIPEYGKEKQFNKLYCTLSGIL